MADDTPADKSHEKHLQLGVDLSGVDEDPVFLDPGDGDQIEDVWADATTVEQFKIDIEELAKNGGL